jgi:drug/metabolite transporter (DMT)-like permease
MKTDYILISLLIGLFWGVSPIIQKHLLKKFDKFSLMLFFSTIYFCLLLSTSAFYHKNIMKDLRLLNNWDTLLIIVYVFFTIFLSNLLILHLLKTHDSYIVSAIIEGSAPLFTLLLVYLFFEEKITLIGVVGVLLIVLGIVCIAMNGASFKIEEFLDVR